MRGGVDEREASAMTLVERRPALVLAVMVNVQVVPDDDDASRRPLGEFLHELDEVSGRPALATLPVDLSGGRVERRQQGAGAVSAVLELSPSLRVPRRGRFDARCVVVREEALLVDAEHGHTLLWGDVVLAHSAGLLDELRVLAVEPHADPVRPDRAVAENPPHFADADEEAGFLQERSLKRLLRPQHPKRRLVIVDALAGEADEASSDFERHHRWSPGPVDVIECFHRGIRCEAVPPAPDRTHAATDPVRDALVVPAGCCTPHDASPLHQPVGGGLPTRELLELRAQVLGDPYNGGRWTRHGP